MVSPCANEKLRPATETSEPLGSRCASRSRTRARSIALRARIASRAKSPSSSRLMRTRRLRLNSAVTPRLVIISGDQGLDVLAQVDADDRLAARVRHARASGEAARRLLMVRDCRASSQEKTRRGDERECRLGMSKSTVKSAMIGRVGRSGNRSRNRSTVWLRKSAAISIGAYIRGARSASMRISDLIAAPGAVFEQHDPFAAESRHLLGMAAQNRRLGPRQIIFVEARDLLEQFRAALVIEPAAGQRLLSLRQTSEHIGAKRFVLAEFRIRRGRAFKRLPRVSAPRTAIAHRGERNCGNSAACDSTGVAHEPPRNTNCPDMNLPLYSPTAPSAGWKRG